MLNISGINNGVVLDHIQAGKSMDIYHYLNLQELDCQIAIIKNAKSNKMGKKDILKVECNIDNLDLDIGKLAGSFNDLDLSGGNNIEKVAKVGKVGKVDDIKLSDEDLKIYRDLAERRYMNKIELKTLAPEINVSIPESAGGNLTADDVTDYIRKMLIEQMNSQTSVSHG